MFNVLKKRAGFTLLELLLAIMIMSIMLLPVLMYHTYGPYIFVYFPAGNLNPSQLKY
jgi:prepilin-type N-terminal cleavage/methylation domain-containing protein